MEVEQEEMHGAADKAGDKDKAVKVDGVQSVVVEVVRLRLRRVVKAQRLRQGLRRRQHKRPQRNRVATEMKW